MRERVNGNCVEFRRLRVGRGGKECSVYEIYPMMCFVVVLKYEW